ncbi:hypothetical protein NMS10_003163 [Vibrio cholerae]|nr:hypothetical protein [Vibrio cholerae]EJL6452508.1 hypothetical protein [Vibrio cholerae]
MLSLKQYRKIGIQLLGTNLWLSASVTVALVPTFALTVLVSRFVINDLVILIPFALLLTVNTVHYCTLPLWGAIKLTQAKKTYGEQKVNDFIVWLDSNDETTFEFKN